MIVSDRDSLTFNLSQINKLPLSSKNDGKTWGLAKPIPFTIFYELKHRICASWNILMGRGVCVLYNDYERN